MGKRILKREKMHFFKKIIRICRDPRQAFNSLAIRLLRLVNKGGLAQVNLKGSRLKMYVDLNDMGISNDLFRYGIREEHASSFFKSVLSPGQTIIDIGANIGYYTLMEAEAVGPHGRVFAIEPGPQNFLILTKNVELNDFGNIIDTQHGAISNNNGPVELHVAERSNLHCLQRASCMDNYVKFKDTVEVTAWTLDEFLEDKGVDVSGIDIVRMDIEGHEYLALQGMSKVLSESHSLLLFIEIHPKLIKELWGDGAYLELLGWFENYNFQIVHCSESLSSRVDKKTEIKQFCELYDMHEAVELFLKKN